MGRSIPGNRGHLAAVIRGKNKDGIVGNTQLIHLIQQFTGIGIDLH